MALFYVLTLTKYFRFGEKYKIWYIRQICEAVNIWVIDNVYHILWEMDNNLQPYCAWQTWLVFHVITALKQQNHDYVFNMTTSIYNITTLVYTTVDNTLNLTV